MESPNNTEIHSRFQFDRLEDWQKEEVMKRKREQAKLREILAAQVEDKKRQKAKLEQSRKDEEERLDKNIQLHFQEQEKVKTKLPIRKAIESTWGSSSGFVEAPTGVEALSVAIEQKTKESDTAELVGNDSDGFSTLHHTRFQFNRLEPWKQSQLKKKQEEQAKVRRDLAAQIELKRAREERERHEREKNEAKEERMIKQQQAELHKRFEESAAQNPFSPTHHQLPIVKDKDKLLTKQTESTSISPKPKPIVNEVITSKTTAETPFKANQSVKDDDTLEFLKQQVVEQQRLLREQSSVMTNLRQLAEAAKVENEETREQMAQLKSALEKTSSINQTVHEPKSKGRSNATDAQSTTQVNSKKIVKTQRRRSTIKITKQLSVENQSHEEDGLEIIPVTLMRDGGGYLRIELEAISDKACIKRVRKSMVQDDRALLQNGDLIVAIGNYKVRATLRTKAKTLQQLPQVPTHDEVRKMFRKCGNRLYFAVCRASRSDIIVSFASEQRSPRIKLQHPCDIHPTPTPRADEPSSPVERNRFGEKKAFRNAPSHDEPASDSPGYDELGDVVQVPTMGASPRLSPSAQSLPAVDKWIPFEQDRQGMSTREREALLSSPNALHAQSVMVLEHCYDPETSMLKPLRTLQPSRMSKYGEMLLETSLPATSTFQ